MGCAHSYEMESPGPTYTYNKDNDSFFSICCSMLTAGWFGGPTFETRQRCKGVCSKCHKTANFIRVYDDNGNVSNWRIEK